MGFPVEFAVTATMIQWHSSTGSVGTTAQGIPQLMTFHPWLLDDSHSAADAARTIPSINFSILFRFIHENFKLMALEVALIILLYLLDSFQIRRQLV
mmetsp:Transcript_7473/g.13514  ORF Transcript_7473/g.13514 Transcript_7473/m.13514 type:complete len:97 (-) Transcript_7473:140-430(-)